MTFTQFCRIEVETSIPNDCTMKKKSIHAFELWSLKVFRNQKFMHVKYLKGNCTFKNPLVPSRNSNKLKDNQTTK